MEMTDVEGQERQEGRANSNKDQCTDHHGPEHQSNVSEGLGTPKQHQNDPAQHGPLSVAGGIEEFEEFVFDFDDDDLLESIHTQLESPLEQSSK